MTQPRKAARVWSPAIIAVLVLVAAGCSLLPAEKPLPRLFVLTPKSTFDTDLPTVDWQLTVSKPVAEAGLNTARIALRHSPVTLEYFARANWIDTAPTMVQTLIIESFENTNKIIAVGRRSVALRADYSLMTELREFQAEYDGNAMPTVRVRINAKLIKMPQRSIIATTTVENKIIAENADLESVVHTFDDALGKTLKTLVAWALRAAPAKIARPRRRPIRLPPPRLPNAAPGVPR